MSRYLDRAKELRAVTEIHYNCAQSVLVPFAEDFGLSEEKAYALASAFGAGMKMGGVCGAITGGLMVMGLLGIDTDEARRDYYGALKAAHGGVMDCAGLLKACAAQGISKKVHCDGMVYECLTLVEDLYRKYGPRQQA